MSHPSDGTTSAVLVVRSVALRLIIGMMIGVLARIFLPGAESDASHPKGPAHDHVGGINSFDSESVCFQLIGNPSISLENFRTRVVSTLTLGGGNDWDRLDHSIEGNKVAFLVADIRDGQILQCDEHPNRLEIELEYHVVNDPSSTNPPCWDEATGETFSCAFADGQFLFDPASSHNEWTAYRVQFKTAHVNQADPGEGQPKPWWHVVNHETGHMLGLADPPPCDPVSVMHPNFYYGCAANLDWPTAADHQAVLDLIHGTSATGGGGVPTTGKLF